MLSVETNSTSKQPTTFATDEGEGGHTMSPHEEITNMNFLYALKFYRENPLSTLCLKAKMRVCPFEREEAIRGYVRIRDTT